MKKLLFCFILSLSLGLNATPSAELIFSINGSIVKVHSANKDGNHSVGSGVVVMKDHVVTNCHVIGNSQGVHVTKFGKSYAPQALIADWENDICILKFKYLDLDPVKLATNNALEYETQVFAKSYGGNTVKPHTTFGRVKGIYKLNQYKIIKSSAWFAIGASGGGLFNYNGELIGITTFKPPWNSEYYSMPVEIIKELLSNGKEVSVTTQPQRPFWDTLEANQPFFMRVAGPLKNKSWTNLKNITTQWVNQNPEEIEANYYHAFSLYQLKDYETARNILEKVIKENNKHALAYFYLYKIAIEEKEAENISYYESKILELDDSLISKK